MLKSLAKAASLWRPAIRSYSNTAIPPLYATGLAEKYPAKYQEPREAWIENFNTVEEQKLGILPLHPDVFAQMPRIDIIHQNVTWQKKYRFVSFAHSRTRAECPGGGRKPWPQKGIGFHSYERN